MSVLHTVSSPQASRTSRGCSFQIRVPVPQQAPQGLGAGDAVPQDPQMMQLGRMVPCEVGRVFQTLAVADGAQQVDDQQAGQWIHPTAGAWWPGMAFRSSIRRRMLGTVGG